MNRAAYEPSSFPPPLKDPADSDLETRPGTNQSKSITALHK